MENRSVNQPIKPAAPRSTANEPPTEKKPAKANATASGKTTTMTQKLPNASRPMVNAPVKPMSNKRTLSPMDDRLSDEECRSFDALSLLSGRDTNSLSFSLEASPDPSNNVSTIPSNSTAAQASALARRPSHTTLGETSMIQRSSSCHPPISVF